MKFLLKISLFALLLTACINEKDDSVKTLDVGDSIPKFAVTLNNGEVVSDTTLKGTAALIVFFHTSCSDCQHELPIVQQIYEKRTDCRVVCISREQSGDSVEEYWQQHNFTMPYSAQTTREIYNLFAVSHIPQMFLVNPQGKITHHWDDANMPTFETLAAALD